MNELPLVGWKEIAAALGECEAATRRKYRESLETKNPMPLHKNGRVKAFSSELQKWLCNQPRP